MKVLVISDSHRRLEKLIKIYELERPDVVLCAGDHCNDGEELSFVHPDSRYCIVRGNCDIFDRKYSDEMTVELEGKKILLAHGHEYGVKYSYDSIFEKAKQLKCDMAIFGHTHIPYKEDREGITLFNPGAVKDGEYGILNIDKDKYIFVHKTI